MLATRATTSARRTVVGRSGNGPCVRLIQRRDKLRKEVEERIAIAKDTEKHASFTEIAHAWDAVEEVSARLSQVLWKLDECLKDAQYCEEREQQREYELSRRSYDL
jgi:hypothetical protein